MSAITARLDEYKFSDGPLTVEQFRHLRAFSADNNLESAVSLVHSRLESRIPKRDIETLEVADFMIILQRCVELLPKEPPPTIPPAFFG